jgi:hypothetical protein
MKSLQEFVSLCKQKIPAEYISFLPLFSKGKKIGQAEYLSWPMCCELLDKYCDLQWLWEIRTHQFIDRVVVEGKLSIYTSDGIFMREATGYELMECTNFGDPTSNAEAMAIRRCCAKFGLGRYLWEKEEKVRQNMIVELPSLGKQMQDLMAQFSFSPEDIKAMSIKYIQKDDWKKMTDEEKQQLLNSVRIRGEMKLEGFSQNPTPIQDESVDDWVPSKFQDQKFESLLPTSKEYSEKEKAIAASIEARSKK